MPDEDVAPVIHAHWVDAEDKPVPFSRRKPAVPADMCWCSNCGALLNPSFETDVIGKYCPNCGSRMDEEVKDEA